MSGSDGITEDECGVTVNRPEEPPKVQVGPPYNPTIIGDPLPPVGLRMLMAYLDGRDWPLQICGDAGLGVNATPWGFMDDNVYEYAAIDDPSPIPDYPLDPPIYPGTGITAYGCEIDCNYLITGPLGAEAIIGKIDDQWHILRVTGSANTIPLFGPSNECRCCGDSLKNKILRAEIIAVNTAECAEYEIGQRFRLDPLFSTSGLNPLNLSLSCQATPDSILEDKNDWTAFACGIEAAVLDISCCAPYDDSGSGSGSGSEQPCRFEARIRTAIIEDCATCSYDILIWSEDEEACIEFEDEPFGEPVIMEACGLDELEPGTRVIMARIPATDAGRAAIAESGASGSGSAQDDPIEWFVVRACTPKDCANPCEVDPPVGPLCCGKRCSEMPETVTVSITVLAGDFTCDPPASITLHRTSTVACDGAADTRWTLPAAIPEQTLCPDVTPDPPHYPTYLDVKDMLLVCGTAEDLCGNVDPPVDGPNFDLQLMGGLVSGLVSTTIDLQASCCDPFYLEFTITGQFWMVAGAGVINHEVTLKLVVTA